MCLAASSFTSAVASNGGTDGRSGDCWDAPDNEADDDDGDELLLGASERTAGHAFCSDANDDEYGRAKGSVNEVVSG